MKVHKRWLFEKFICSIAIMIIRSRLNQRWFTPSCKYYLFQIRETFVVEIFLMYFLSLLHLSNYLKAIVVAHVTLMNETGCQWFNEWVVMVKYLLLSLLMYCSNLSAYLLKLHKPVPFFSHVIQNRFPCFKYLPPNTPIYIISLSSGDQTNPAYFLSNIVSNWIFINIAFIYKGNMWHQQLAN